MKAEERKPLGYAMKVKELNRLLTVVGRMKEQVRLADENRAKLTDAISLLRQVSPLEYQEALIYLKQDIKWMYLILDSCKVTSHNIEKRIKSIITLKQMKRAKQSAKEQEEMINKTFSKE